MSEEEKIENKECKCFCQSKGFRKFLVIALGTFVGVYGALSLFAALHRPPMMPPCPYAGYRMPAPIAAPCPFAGRKPHFDKGFKGDNFHKNFKDNKGPAPFEMNREHDKD